MKQLLIALLALSVLACGKVKTEIKDLSPDSGDDSACDFTEYNNGMLALCDAYHIIVMDGQSYLIAQTVDRAQASGFTGGQLLYRVDQGTAVVRITPAGVIEGLNPGTYQTQDQYALTYEVLANGQIVY